MNKPVDVLAAEERRRELKVLMPAFQMLDPNDRHKAYVAAAWAFVREGDIEEALRLVDLLPLDYVTSVMPAQMDQDPAFDHMCEVVANALVDAQVHVPVYHPPSGTFVASAGLA